MNLSLPRDEEAVISALPFPGVLREGQKRKIAALDIQGRILDAFGHYFFINFSIKPWYSGEFQLRSPTTLSTTIPFLSNRKVEGRKLAR